MRGLPLLVVATFSMAVPAPRRAGLTYGPNVVQLTASNLKDKVDDGYLQWLHGRDRQSISRRFLRRLVTPLPTLCARVDCGV
jgi:hypothetical protein